MGYGEITELLKRHGAEDKKASNIVIFQRLDDYNSATTEMPISHRFLNVPIP